MSRERSHSIPYQRIARFGFFILLALIALPTLLSPYFPDILDYVVRQPAQAMINFLLR